jgi:hypothetical protein
MWGWVQLSATTSDFRNVQNYPSSPSGFQRQSELPAFAYSTMLRGYRWGVSQSHRVEDGTQDDLVGAALQDDLHVPLEQTRLREELGLGSEGLWRLRAVRLTLERRTLERGYIECNMPFSRSLSKATSSTRSAFICVCDHSGSGTHNPGITLTNWATQDQGGEYRKYSKYLGN